jgi:hypothetical protein
MGDESAAEVERLQEAVVLLAHYAADEGQWYTDRPDLDAAVARAVVRLHPDPATRPWWFAQVLADAAGETGDADASSEP